MTLLTIRHNLGFDDVSLYFSKEFLRFRKEDLVNLYSLMRFPEVVRLHDGNLTMNYFNVILPDNFIHYYMNKIVL